MDWKYLSYSLRGFYLLLILTAAIYGKWGAVAFNGIIFAVTLLVPYLASRNKDYHAFDSALMLLFILPLGATFFGYVMRSSTFGEDKLFHLAGGALLGWFALITFRPHIKRRWVLAAVAVFFAAAVGAWWEVYEWIMLLFKNDVMRLSLPDSMLDIIADTLGAIAVAAFSMKKK